MGSSCWNIQPDPFFLFAPVREDGHRRLSCIPEKNKEVKKFNDGKFHREGASSLSALSL